MVTDAQLTNDFKYLFSILLDANSAVALTWTAHTTIMIAMIGWILSKKEDFHKLIKVFGAVAYSVVLAVFIIVIQVQYRQLWRMTEDIKSLVGKQIAALPSCGYVNCMLKVDWQFWENFSYFIFATSWATILFLLWIKPKLYKE